MGIIKHKKRCKKTATFFIFAEDGTCKVVAFQKKGTSHTVEVVNGTLTIRFVNEKKWYDYINFNIQESKLTIYLPQAQYDALIHGQD